MLSRLGKCQHGSNTSITPGKDLTPFVAGFRPKNDRELRFQGRPLVLDDLRAEGRITGAQPARIQQAEPLEKSPIKLRLDGRHGQVTAVLGFVDVVVVSTATQQVCACPVGELTNGAIAEEHRHERQSTIEHGRIDDLAAPRPASFEHSTHYSEGQQQPSPAKIADDIEGHDGLATSRSDLM